MKRLDQLARRYELDARAIQALERLLAALAAEPAPPTAVSDPARSIDTHVADSLSGLEVDALREAESIADIGSGAGFPGLPLAIALPDARVDLVEATRSKCEVIDRLGGACGASNARVVCARVEEWDAGQARCAAVTARALAALPVLVEYAAPVLQDGGVLVAWKGARDEDEERAGQAAAAQVGLELEEIRPVEPFKGAHSRHLHTYRKTSPTPEGFPRRPGIAVKRSLAWGR